MKTIRVLRNTGNHLPRFTEGQVVDVPDETANLLCGLKLAELLKTIPAEPLRAVPENPSIVAAEAKLNDIKERWTAPAPEPPKHKRHPKSKPEFKE